MKKIFMSVLLVVGLAPVAHAGMFDDLVNAANSAANEASEAVKAKEMVRVELPLKAIKKKDSRITKIQVLAVKVAIKHKWKLQVACPSGKYCSHLKKDVDAEAWRVARSMVGSDYAAKSKLPKVELVTSNHYEIALMRKGF